MLNLKKSPIKKDIDKIIHYPHSGTNKQYYDITVHTVKDDYTLKVIDSIETMRDYNSNSSDYTIISFHLPMGDFIKGIYPFKNNLEATLIKKVGQDVDVNRYKLVLLNLDNNVVAGMYDNYTLDELNKLEYIKVTGQVVHKNIEALRQIQTSGIYTNTNVKDVIVSALTKCIKRVTVDGQGIKYEIAVIDPNNKRTYEHIIIPAGIDVLDIPTYLDDTDYGVYNGHIGTYIQKYDGKLTIFVYPLYNHIVNNVAKGELLIYQLPNHQYEFIDRTYIVDADTISIVSGESSLRHDKGDDDIIDTGSGFRSLEANSVMNRPIDVTANKITSNEQSKINKFRLKDMEDGGVYTRLVKSTDNLYLERSKILKQGGSIVQVQWNYSNVDLLYPGMPVSYIYVKNNTEVIRRRGVLQSLYVNTNNPKKMSIAILNIFLENIHKGYRQ